MKRQSLKRQPVPLEASIKKAIMKYLNSLPQCRARAVNGNERLAGEPDIDCVIQGRAFKPEVKRPAPYGTPVTKLQGQTMEKWHQAGAITGVVRSVEDVKEMLRKEGLI